MGTKITIYSTSSICNKKTIETVENILEHDKNSIIIIQGDHGTAWGGIIKSDPPKEDVLQRLRNFDAIYFPDEEKRIQLNDNRTLVNTFRIVFNSYFGSDYEILDDRMYWGWNEKPYSFDEVTQFLLDSN